jgi:hypothetical protein
MKWTFDHQGTNFVSKLKSITELNVLTEVVYNCNKQDLTWTNNKESREEICRKLDIANITFHKALASLVDVRLLIKKSRGNYKLNDLYINFGKHER